MKKSKRYASVLEKVEKNKVYTTLDIEAQAILENSMIKNMTVDELTTAISDKTSEISTAQEELGKVNSGEHPDLVPLKEAEETRLLKLVETENSIEARNILIEHNLRLVVFLAKKYGPIGTATGTAIALIF
mgnify:CR=1 FL=1